MSPTSCTLCFSTNTIDHAAHEFKYGHRTWLRCLDCDLIFVGRNSVPSIHEEKQEYLLHNNSADDTGYVSFLQSFITPLTTYLIPGGSGLDFGSGPTPVLAEILRKQGYDMHCYDPIFAANSDALERKYDFIVATEVFEHFHFPAASIDRVVKALGPGSILGVMTSLWDDQREFLKWHYIRERSHISFYSKNTVAWIARKWSLKILSLSDNKIFFTRR